MTYIDDYMEMCMSGHVLHSHMKISVDTVNYLIFLVCMNDVDILVDKNK